jgi:hypothetical protein
MERWLLQMLDMFNTRLLLALAFAAIVPTSVGCAPPTPGEEVGDSYDNLTKDDPANANPLVLTIRGSNHLETASTPLVQFIQSVKIQPGTTTKITGTLTIMLETKRGLSSEVKGCAGGFSTKDLSPAEIAAKDYELLQACANPVEKLEGRAGWAKYDKPNNKAMLSYNATSSVSENQHIVFAFALNGNVQTYIFEH